MKTLKLIFTLIVLAGIFQTTSAQEINYLEVLDPVYLTGDSQSSIMMSSYERLNKQLIEKGKINFNREIKQARKNKELLVLNGNENALSLEKAEYLRVLRKAANRSENVNEFYTYLNKQIPIIKKANISDNDLFKLFDVTRRNTTNGKLDIVSADLSWL